MKYFIIFIDEIDEGCDGIPHVVHTCDDITEVITFCRNHIQASLGVERYRHQYNTIYIVVDTIQLVYRQIHKDCVVDYDDPSEYFFEYARRAILLREGILKIPGVCDLDMINEGIEKYHPLIDIEEGNLCPAGDGWDLK